MAIDPFLGDLLKRSARSQTLLFKGAAVVSTLTGLALLALVAFGPKAKPGEEGWVLFIGAFAVIMVVFGPGFWWWTNGVVRKVRRLLENPSRISDVKLIRAARRGVVFYGVHLFDEKGRRAGMLVPDEATGTKAMERIAALRADAV